MSTLFVENLKGPTTGANANKIIVPSGQTIDASAGTLVPSAGQIVQQVFKNSGNTNSTTSTSYVATDTSVTITPLYSNSNMLIFLAGTAYSANTSGYRGKIFKNGVEWSEETSEDLCAYLNTSTEVGSIGGRLKVDENVNTTSPITYTYYIKKAGASGLAYWYRNTCIVVQEIKQ